MLAGLTGATSIYVVLGFDVNFGHIPTSTPQTETTTKIN